MFLFSNEIIWKVIRLLVITFNNKKYFKTTQNNLIILVLNEKIRNNATVLKYMIFQKSKIIEDYRYFI